MFVNIIKVFIL